MRRGAKDIEGRYRTEGLYTTHSGAVGVVAALTNMSAGMAEVRLTLDMSAAAALASKVASGISRPANVLKGSWSLPSEIPPLMRPRSLPAMISIESAAIIGEGIMDMASE